ncbi:MAG: type II toxin-antitoxin system RelE/ParE family toxin [Proteobacteria bacterium]|nr:type II toxin-antitoxin system RelE/ParE family toxin [Pseudomonadota bacterium]
MRVVVTPQFTKSIKKFHANQKADIDKAVKAVLKNPSIGVQKVRDLSWFRIHKFRMVSQLALLAYEIDGTDRIVLHNLGSHENFYRDLKAR